MALERQLMRPRMRVMILRLPGEMIAALDNERRKYPKIPARNAIAREFAFAFLDMWHRSNGPVDLYVSNSRSDICVKPEQICRVVLVLQ